jgi:predicted HicB family RNase H-like nuclease
MKSYFKARGIGRPRVGNKQLSLRLAPELIAKLGRAADRDGVSKSQLVARWIKNL